MKIRQLAQHRWTGILPALGIPDNLLTKRHQPCPFCKDGTDRFRFTDHEGLGRFICSQCGSGDGFEFLMRYHGKAFAEVAEDIKSVIGHTEVKPPQNADLQNIRRKLNKQWQAAKPLSKGCPTHRYLLHRGLKGLSFGTLTGLRCHPGLDYWHNEDGEWMKLGRHPAMIGLATCPEGLPVTLHITYLTADGRKAALDPVRKVMTPSRKVKGYAVRLQTLQDDQILCVAEGIETALSMKLFDPECCPWACLNAANMEQFVPPSEYANSICIAADNDESMVGQKAAYTLAKKLVHKLGKGRASVLMPEKQGHDFNDQLNERGGYTAE